jgi:hypothetical protein
MILDIFDLLKKKLYLCQKKEEIVSITMNEEAGTLEL